MRDDGLKHRSDEHEAFWIAHLMSVGILPTGYICPPALRAVRDLLRKRLHLVRHRTPHLSRVEVTSSQSERVRLTFLPETSNELPQNGQLQTVNWGFEALIVDDIAP